MSDQITYIVGDKFKNFATNHGVITISEMEALTTLDRIGPFSERLYLIGQGVSPRRLKALKSKIRINKLEKYFPIKNGYVDDHKMNQKSVHKQKTENVMISIPKPHGTDSYESCLILDDETIEMSDHVTGQHIQGMVLIEAARQMMLSVTEHYILQPEQKEKMYFIINDLNSKFYHFAFPLELFLRCGVIEMEHKQHGSIKATVEISFIQNEKLVTVVTISFSVYDQDFIHNKESMLANDLVKKYQNVDSLSYANNFSKKISTTKLDKKVAFG